MNTTASADSAVTATKEDTTTAIVAYLTLIGFIAAVIIHGNKKTKLGAFHLRQALGIMLTWLVLGVCLSLPLLNLAAFFTFPLLTLGMLALIIVGLIPAINGKMTPVPVLGEQYQKWFGNAFE